MASAAVPPRPLFPSRIEKAYRAMLDRRVLAAQRVLFSKLGPALGQVSASIDARADESKARTDSIASDVAALIRVVSQVEAVFGETFKPEEGAIVGTARSVDRHATRETYQAVPSIKVAGTPALSKLYRTWAQENVDLIKTIDSRYFDDIRNTIEDAVKTGRSTREIVKELAERYSVSRSRAELIAVDQIAKLNSKITQNRQEGLGIKKYRWSTSKDRRVRPEHRALDGKIFSWSDPHPTEGHPGHAVRCRCAALPYMEEDEALKEEVRNEQAKRAKRQPKREEPARAPAMSSTPAGPPLSMTERTRQWRASLPTEKARNFVSQPRGPKKARDPGSAPAAPAAPAPIDVPTVRAPSTGPSTDFAIPPRPTAAPMSAARPPLVVAPPPATWQPKPGGGFTLSDGDATLEKRGKDWLLRSGGTTVNLGKKGSFTTAERALGKVRAAAVAKSAAVTDYVKPAPITPPTWVPKAGGTFALSDGSATLEKSGKDWSLVTAAGSVNLGKRASLATASRALGTMSTTAAAKAAEIVAPPVAPVAPRTWLPKAGGIFALSDGSATLEKVGGDWTLVTPTGSVSLGRKASFAIAERELAKRQT